MDKDTETKDAAEVEPKGFSGMLKKTVSFILTAIQTVPLAEGWISYGLGSITASLFTPLSDLSLLWYPIDIVFKYIWIACDFLKHKLWNRHFTRKASSDRWEEHFPSF